MLEIAKFFVFLFSNKTVTKNVGHLDPTGNDKTINKIKVVYECALFGDVFYNLLV